MNQPKLSQPPDRSQSMSDKEKKNPKSKNHNHDHNKSQNQENSDKSTQKILATLNSLKDPETLKDYPIRELVKHSEEFGKYLKDQRLETNQIRKFLDAINRLKVRLTQNKNHQSQESIEQQKQKVFQFIESDIVLLKPKLAYAAARLNGNAKQAAKDLSDVMGKAIDKTLFLEDFERLVQFMESIIAYHKSAGGK